jgi:hypothetical protein
MAVFARGKVVSVQATPGAVIAQYEPSLMRLNVEEDRVRRAPSVIVGIFVFHYGLDE